MSHGAVFWDFDGTLARREGDWPRILLDAVRSIDPKFDPRRAEQGIGSAARFPHYGPDGLRLYPSSSAWWAAQSPVLRAVYRSAGVDALTAESAIAVLPQIYYAPDSWRLMPGASSALRITAVAGLRNVILSNHAPELPQLVADLGLEPQVHRTLTSAALGVEKPDPTIFRLALHICAAGTDSWMIGDNPVNDVGAARSAGMRALLVHSDHGGRPARSLLSAAKIVVRDHQRPTAS